MKQRKQLLNLTMMLWGYPVKSHFHKKKISKLDHNNETKPIQKLFQKLSKSYPFLTNDLLYYKWGTNRKSMLNCLPKTVQQYTSIRSSKQQLPGPKQQRLLAAKFLHPEVVTARLVWYTGTSMIEYSTDNHGLWI